jgi:hypothetical protein
MHDFENEIQQLIQLLKTENNFEVVNLSTDVFSVLNRETSISVCISFYKQFPSLSNSLSNKNIILPYDIFLFNSSEKIFRFIRNKLILLKTIFARNLIFREISEADAHAFLTANHIMNYAKAHKWYGLRSINDHKLYLLAGISKGKKIYNDHPVKNLSIELVRICTAYDYVVAGGLKKLLHHILLIHPNTRDFVTYVDSGWSSGSGLTKAGFIKEPAETIFTFLVSPKKNKIEKINPDYAPTLLLPDEYIRVSMPVWKFRCQT